MVKPAEAAGNHPNHVPDEGGSVIGGEYGIIRIIRTGRGAARQGEDIHTLAARILLKKYRRLHPGDRDG
jgi:hypothetical protein